MTGPSRVITITRSLAITPAGRAWLAAYRAARAKGVGDAFAQRYAFTHADHARAIEQIANGVPA